MLSIRNSKYTDIGRLKVKGQKKYIMQTLIKESQYGHTDIRQSRLQSEEYCQGIGRILHTKKEVIHFEDIILNVYASNNRASKYMNQKLRELKGEIDKSKTEAGGFSIPFSVIELVDSPAKNKSIHIQKN